MATGTEVMKNFFKVLKNYSQETGYVGRTALDEAVRAVTPLNNLEQAITFFEGALLTDTIPQYSEMDSDTRLKEITGMVLGADEDLSADTGAISGANAGGSTVKDAQSIVPEDGDLSTAILPAEGSTTQITYTGDDGKSFTFNVKWPDSFHKFISGTAVDSSTDISTRLKDSRFLVDLNDFDENENFYKDDPVSLLAMPATYGDMKNSAQTILKGLNTYWLKGGAKLIYDSYGLDFDGKTIEIQFVAGGKYSSASGITQDRNDDNLPADNIIIGINLANYGQLDETNPNGLVKDSLLKGISQPYLDRVVAHEMVHAAMMASGTIKDAGMPVFFVEGVADLIQGDDDYNSEQLSKIRGFFSDSDTLVEALSFERRSSAAYPAGDMFLRFIANSANDTDIFVGDDTTKNQTLDFNGNATIITKYDESNAINYNAGFKNAKVSETFNDFVANTGDEDLIIRDVRGKMMTFTNNGANVAYALMANSAGEVDGRSLGDGNKFEVLFGANNVSNTIHAGNGGSQLWGGYLGNDELYGGSGVDTFIYDINGGNDTVHGAESQDVVLLRNTSLDQLTRADITDNGVNLSFTYGGTLNIEGKPTTFVIEDNDVSYTADYQNKTWNSSN